MASLRAAHIRSHGRRGVLVLALLLVPVAAAAQDSGAYASQAPAHISLVDGVAVLERDGRADQSPANMPLLAGDRVRTRTGRVEIVFADGSTLHMDQFSTIDLQSDELVRLIEGRIRLSIPGPTREVYYRLDGPHGWATISEPGDYRLSVSNAPATGEMELAVLRGRAELANEDGRTPLRAGERAFVRADAAPSYAYVVNSAAWDAFDRWSEARRNERLAANTQYLPDEVRPYAASFEQYGYWGDEPVYGRVWYPRVALGWRPYYYGRWAMLRPYGWTWVPHDPWGWPTHHYGRWGHSHAGWFWIPGRTWGAAWVSWAYAPGYVSWCPLGWNNRAVFSINVNIGGYDPWRAWTVVPHTRFGVGYVHRSVVQVDRLDYRVRTSFAHGDRPPSAGGYAVPRGSVPIRVAGTHDGRRPAPLYTNVPAERARVNSEGPRIDVPAATGARASSRSTSPQPTSATGRPDTTGRAVPRDRAMPSGPATRSSRVDIAQPPVRSGQASTGESTVQPGQRPRDTGSARSERTRDAAPDRRPESRVVPGSSPSMRPSMEGGVEVYRGTPIPPQASRRAPDSAAAPSYGSRGQAVPRGSDGSADGAPAGYGARPRPSGDSYGRSPSGPGYGGVAAPRGLPSTPDRGSAGSTQRSGPSGAPPPARAEQPSRSGPPAGARPRGGRGGGAHH